MSSISSPPISCNLPLSSPSPSKSHHFPSSYPLRFSGPSPCSLRHLRRRDAAVVSIKSSEAEELPAAEDEWLERLPEKTKPLYSHSLPCIEAWLRDLGFRQSGEDRAVWLVEKAEWHAQLSLDVTDLTVKSFFMPFATLLVLFFCSFQIMARYFTVHISE